MSYLYATFIYNPLYNGFVLLVNAVHGLSWIDMGIVVVIFTIIVRLILFPISKKAARTQVLMRLVEPELAVIKEKYKDDKQAQATKTMALYKEKKINPFSSILLLLIQLPILLAIYRIFYSSSLSTVPAHVLYSFVAAPATISPFFLGLFDVTKKSFFLALIAAVSQFLQINLATPKTRRDSEGRMTQESMMHMMMKLTMPVMILLVAWNVASALAIYWATSNLFMVGQELYIRRQIAKESINGGTKPTIVEATKA